MAAFCSLSEHCESDVREKLQKVVLSSTDIQRIIDRLYDDGFLDTARYCRAFSRDKLRFSHWGRVKIQQALRMKGLPDADIRQALQDLTDELGPEYRQILQSLLEQKARSLSSSSSSSSAPSSSSSSSSSSMSASSSASSTSSMSADSNPDDLLADDDISFDEDSANDYARRQKLIRFAANRGFTLDEIMDVLVSL